jgi:hypothetical protein
MNVKYVLESGLFERRDIRSGRIYQPGASPKYGVIFTANAEKSEDDSGLLPELMPGAFIEGVTYPETESDRIFEILGGYFYHDNYPAPGIATNVFGIALEPEFGMTEGGMTTLKEKWVLEDPKKPMLDESYWSKEFGKHHGWTFIVTLKEKEKYPTSDEEMKIFVYYPEIQAIDITYGGCIADNKLRRRKVKFTVTVAGGKCESWTWHFGDGTTKTGTGRPETTIEYLYLKKPAISPKLCLLGHKPCEEVSKEVELTDFEECLPCPVITDIKYKSIARINQTDTHEFTADVSRQPDALEWDFGDGTPKEKTNVLNIKHSYKIPAQDTTYSVQVTSFGPEDCRDSMEKSVLVKSAAAVSKCCIWFNLLIAFLFATTSGTFLVYCVGKFFDKIENYGWLITILIIQILLAITAIIGWYILVRQKKCSEHVTCDWIKIGWVVSLAGMSDAVYVRNCCANWWLAVILILLGFAGYLIYTWIKKCSLKIKELAYYLIVCFLAVVLVCYFVADGLLGHCLH